MPRVLLPTMVAIVLAARRAAGGSAEATHGAAIRLAPSLPARLPAHVEFVNSGAAAVCATVLVNPFDVVKTRLQLQRTGPLAYSYRGVGEALSTIARREGLRGLQRGLVAASLLQFTNVASRFGLYGLGTRVCIGADDDPRTRHLKRMAIGACAGGVAALVTCPLFLLKTRFQAQSSLVAQGALKYTSIAHATRTIYAAEGLAGFWKGLPAFATRVAVASSVQLSTYDTAKGALVHAGMPVDSTFTHLAASLVAGGAIVVATQPLDFVATRLMNDPARTMGGRFRNGVDVVAQAVRAEGPSAIFAGTLARFFRIAPYNCLVFLFLEQFRGVTARALAAAAAAETHSGGGGASLGRVVQ